MHGLTADSALQSQKAETIKPCHYKFPSTTFEEAITFAATFTDVVLGTLQDVVQVFAQNNDDGLARLVASVIGQEGEQDGFFRLVENMAKIPSQLPFLTTSTRDFAFSSLEQGVIVSCPNDQVLKEKLKLFGVLNLLTTNVGPKAQNLQFSFDLKSLESSNLKETSAYQPSYDWSQVSLVYINQQNTPVVEKLQNAKVQGSVITFDAWFPYEEHMLNGLSIAAVTRTSGPFANASAVADDTLFAPAFIDFN